MKTQGQKFSCGRGWKNRFDSLVWRGWIYNIARLVLRRGWKWKKVHFSPTRGKMPLDSVDSWCIFAPLESYFSKIRVAFTLEQLCWILCIGQTCLNIQWPPKFAYMQIKYICYPANTNSIFMAYTCKMTSFQHRNLYFSPWNSFQLGWISSFRFLHIA